MDCQTGEGKTIRKLVKLEIGAEIRGVGKWEDSGVYAERLGIEGVLLRIGREEEDEWMATVAMLEAKEYNARGNKNRNKGPASGTTEYRRTRDVAAARGAESKQNGQYAYTYIAGDKMD